MIRIVGGTARGRVLSVPGRGTRPTSDRTREALFNTLTGLIDLTGAAVLDLYAGTGGTPSFVTGWLIKHHGFGEPIETELRCVVRTYHRRRQASVDR